MNNNLWLCVAAALLGFVRAAPRVERPLVEVAQGKVLGEARQDHGVSYLAFEGIPFARPPTRSLRFKDPEPAEAWEGELDASSLPPPCAQFVLGGREDCLYLNVYAPQNALDAEKPLPVMVFIHGGGFYMGAALNNHGFQPMVAKGVIVVAMQYRLGILGFLSTEDPVAPGNLGLKDQTLALRWIKDNIAFFGGDSDRITLYGGSAGAASVHYQMLAPAAAEDFAARHSDVNDCVLLSDWFRNLSEANTAGKRTTNMPRKLRSTSSGDKPSVVRKHDDPTSTSQEAGGAPSSRSYSSEPGPSISRQTDAARLRRGSNYSHTGDGKSQTRSFLDLLDESDFSESDDDWLPEAVTSSGRLIGVEEAVTSSDSDSEEDLQEISVSSTAGEPRRLFYLRNKSFVDHAPQNATENLGACNLLKPIEYFLSYVSEDFLGDIAMYTNMKSIETTGACINTNSKEIATFIGMTFAMSIIKMPRIRMYWQSKTRIPWIADKMARERFFRLRHSLKVINDNTVLEDDKKSDRLWKVRPLLEAVRTRCSELPRPSKVSIDESMIPFRGRISIRQHVPGKPFPDGLKMFVLASPSGMVLDFEIFQTKEALLSIIEKLNVKPNRTLTTGEAAVLRFVRSVDAGTSIFFDRFFTSSNLLCDLYDRGLRGTGTIKKNMVPKEAKQILKTEATLRKEGRGASDCQVRNDNKVAVTAWYDKKLVLMASNEFSIDDEDICQRWSKATNTHVGVKRPRVVREYNSAMGGVDVHDQIVSYYRSPNRTKKWTVRVVLHVLDVVTANCWLEYRKDMESKPKQYLDFKLILADQLMSGDFFDHATDSQSISDASLSSVDCIDSETDPPLKAAKQGLTPLPNRAERKKGASHLPIVIDGKNSFRRCRREGCKNRTRTLCSQCNVFLCNYAKRNCFLEFHV